MFGIFMIFYPVAVGELKVTVFTLKRMIHIFVSLVLGFIFAKVLFTFGTLEAWGRLFRRAFRVVNNWRWSWFSDRLYLGLIIAVTEEIIDVIIIVVVVGELQRRALFRILLQIGTFVLNFM